MRECDQRVKPRRLSHRFLQTSQLESVNGVLWQFIVERRQHDDRHVANRSVCPDHLGQLQPVDVRHRSVDDDHGKRLAHARCRPQHIERIAGTARLSHRNAAPRHLCVEHFELCVALHHDQHPGSAQLIATIADSRLRFIDGQRETEPKRRALARLACHADLAAHQFDQLL